MRRRDDGPPRLASTSGQSSGGTFSIASTVIAASNSDSNAISWSPTCSTRSASPRRRDAQHAGRLVDARPRGGRLAGSARNTARCRTGASRTSAVRWAVAIEAIDERPVRRGGVGVVVVCRAPRVVLGPYRRLAVRGARSLGPSLRLPVSAATARRADLVPGAQHRLRFVASLSCNDTRIDWRPTMPDPDATAWEDRLIAEMRANDGEVRWRAARRPPPADHDQQGRAGAASRVARS